MTAEIKVPISPGELVDKITILEIKSARMTDAAKVANVRIELGMLQDTWRTSAYAAHDISSQWAALRAINEKLWDIEDLIRDKERARTFDQEFIELARAVHVTNDERRSEERRVGKESRSRWAR